MKSTPIVQIEDKYLRIIKAEGEKNDIDELLLNEGHVFRFPGELKENLKNQPQLLADFIRECLKKCEHAGTDIILTLDSKLGFFKEYKYKKADKKIANERFYLENDNQKKTRDSINITQKIDYPEEKNNKDLSRAAIFGIDDKYFRELLKDLKKDGIDVHFATSTLIMYKNAIEQLLKSITMDLDKNRFIGISIDDQLYRAVIIKDDNLYHLEEKIVPEISRPEDKNLLDFLTDFLKENDIDKDEAIAVISGKDNADFAKRLSLYSGMKCYSAQKLFDDQKPGKVFPVSDINLSKYKNENYTFGDVSKRKFSKATAKIFIAAVIVLALLFSMLPAYYYYLTQTNENLNKEVGRYENSEMLGLIYEKREVLTDLQAYKDDLTKIEIKETSYGNVLKTIDEVLLPHAIITDLVYEEKTGLLVDFIVRDVKRYEKDFDKINDKKEMKIVEKDRSKVKGDALYEIQILVTIPAGDEQ